MPTVFVSCPCCGMTVPPAALNFDAESGQRVEDPKTYGAFVKERGFAPGSHKIQWQAAPAPPVILQGLLVQLERAVQQVRAQLGETT